MYENSKRQLIISRHDKFTSKKIVNKSKMIARAIRGHWIVESDRWHLDVIFRGADNHRI